MEQNALKSINESKKEDHNILKSCSFHENIAEQGLEEKKGQFQNNEYDFKQNVNIPLHVIESCVSHNISQVLTEDTYQIISDFCSNKLIQVIKSAIDCMKFSGRSNLTIADINRGLYVSDEELLIESNIPSSNKGKRWKREDIYKSKRKLNNEKNNLPSVACIDNKWIKGSPFAKDIGNLSPELEKYFNVVTLVLLSKNENMCFKIIQDFKTNSSILNLVPYFVNFFSCNLNKLSHDFLRMSIFLKALQSLLLNSHLYFNQSSFSNELAGTVVQFLVSDMLVSKHAHDYWLLKDTAAYLLVQILKRSESKELYVEIVHNLGSVFVDFQKSLESHYGAVVALNSIGVPAIMLAISPYMNEYSKYINIVYASDFQKRHDVNMIEGQLLYSYYLLIHHYFKYEFFDSYTSNVQHCLQLPFYYLEFLKNNKVFPFLSKSSFVDTYGDRLVQCFPLSNFISYNVNHKIKNINMKGSLDAVNPLRKPILSSIEPPSAFVDTCENNLNKNVKKTARQLNSGNKKFSLKVGITENNASLISKVCNVNRLCIKNSFKESREQIFEIIPFKRHAVKFGKIKGVFS